jgi:hypothetical protein
MFKALMETTSQGSGAAPAAMTPDATIFQILLGKMPIFALGAVARLGVADHLTDQPRPVGELAAACHAHARKAPKNESLNDVLDLQPDSGAGFCKIEQFQQNPHKHQRDARDQQ